jgi:hypothetical protein
VSAAGDDASLVRLFGALAREKVDYVLVGGQAVRLNGFVRATEDVDLLLPRSRENGERLKRALSFLPSAAELEIQWFDPPEDPPENIRIADDMLIDLLFRANGQSYESLAPNIRVLELGGVAVRVLDIDGLLKTKTDYREKDVLDRSALLKLRGDDKG